MRNFVVIAQAPSLSGPTARPPLSRCRVILLYLSHLCFSGVAGYHAIPLEFALSQPRGGRGRGYRSSSQAAPGGVSRFSGGIAEIVSLIAA